MIETWYGVVSFMLIIYVVLDGRNFGVGILHWLVARTPEERRQMVAAIGPLWPWHEVWLVSFGGTLVAVFPRLMASAFAGYYLALFLILWCLIFRGIALEVGGHMKDPLWQDFWDFTLSVSSLLLAILFGAALGNLARGVPLDAHGDFSMAFFTDFKTRGDVGLLDWYTISIALFSAIMLAAHAATYLTLKTDGPVHDRCELYGKWLWLGIAPLLVVVTVETWFVRPELLIQGIENPLSWAGILLVLVAIILLITGLKNRQESKAFIGSNLLIIGLLATGAATIFPVMLYSTLSPDYSLTAYAVASNRTSLSIAAVWWPVALILTIIYYVVITRRYAGKVRLQDQTKSEH